MSEWYLPPTKGDVVQFNENHKWCGALGIVEEVKQIGNDYRVMVGATIPDNQLKCSTAYIYSLLSENEFDFIGKAALMMADKEENE